MLTYIQINANQLPLPLASLCSLKSSQSRVHRPIEYFVTTTTTTTTTIIIIIIIIIIMAPYGESHYKDASDDWD